MIAARDAARDRPQASVGLNFMPAFYRKHLALNYGEDYYFDPRYRAQVGRADLFGIKSGLMNIHEPFTTAHQLCGESLFLLLVDEPDSARMLFSKVWDIYRAIFERLVRELGAAPPRRLQLGDCSASMLSADLYRSIKAC